jgi:integrase
MDLYRHGRYERTVYKTLGRVEALALEEAQAEAAKLAAAIRRGVDPTKQIDVPSMTVRQLLAHYVSDLAERGKGERFRSSIIPRAERHLPKWLDRPFTSITREDCRAAHKRITDDHGPRAANQMMTNFATAWKVALQTLDGDIPLNCPVVAVRRHPEHAKDYSDFTYEGFLADRARHGPVLQLAMTFTLYSGLRKANIIGLQREWLRDDRIVIPRAMMKVKDPRRGPFIVPLSPKMRAILDEALAFGHPTCPLVFNNQGRPLARLPLAHVCRHMHYTEAENLDINHTTICKLHDHAFVGMAKTYNSRAHADVSSLAEAQNRITDRLNLLLGE